MAYPLFPLGPKEWKRFTWRRGPHALREQIRAAFAEQRPCVIMEEVSSRVGEDDDIATKFNRILDTTTFDAIVVVWPRHAKMAAVWDELILLRERLRTTELPPIYTIHHDRAARLGDGVLEILEAGDRSSYLKGAAHLSMVSLEFRTKTTFQSAVQTLVEQLTPLQVTTTVLA